MENRISLKRGLAVLLAAVLAFGILWMPSPARAAGMSMDIEFSPNELSGSGEVKITATIKNLGDDVTDATLTVGDRKIASWSSFISGSSDTVEYSYAKRENQVVVFHRHEHPAKRKVQRRRAIAKGVYRRLPHQEIQEKRGGGPAVLCGSEP